MKPIQYAGVALSSALIVAIVVIVVSVKLSRRNFLVSSRGFEVMRNSKVLICGITRDNAERLPKTIQRIEQLGSCFQDYKVVIYENDSKDKSQQILSEWVKTNPKVIYIQEKLDLPPAIHTGGLSTLRFQRLAQCREKYREEVVNPIYGEYKYVVVVDMDLKDWSLEGIAHSFAQPSWDIISANGRWGPIYYDTLAFRNDIFTDTLNRGNQREMAKVAMKRSRFRPLVPCRSSFGGLAVYKRDCFLACSYTDSSLVDDCEHVIIHNCMRNKGFDKVYMNPAMLVYYH